MPEPYVPTLLVGLGGTGGEVVRWVSRRFYKRVPQKQRQRIPVVFHVLDTDGEDLTEFVQNDPDVGWTQLGPPHMVGYELAQYPKNQMWFPMLPELMQKTFLQGAGQVRPISRLAVASDLAGDGLPKLDAAVDQLLRLAGGSGLAAAPRLMIVSSWAGGTGAGSFLQLALYLKGRFQTEFGPGRSVLIRGYFVLPDTFVKTGKLMIAEQSTVRGHAQACLLELDALSKRDHGKQAGLELEYRQGQGAAPVNTVPYDFSFLFDYSTLGGRNLPSYDTYLEQLSRSVYHSLFSPIANNMYSAEDNQVRAVAQAGGGARYGDAATAVLRYPREEIVRHLAMRLAAGELSDRWLYLDGVYRRELADYQHDLERGDYRAEPERAVVYMEAFKRRSHEDAHPFFKLLYRDAFAQDEEGQPDESRPLAGQWVDAIHAYLRDAIEHQPPKGKPHLDTQVPLDGDGLRNYAGATQQDLARYWRRVKEYVESHANSYAHALLYEVCEEADLRRADRAYRLNHWVFRQHEDDTFLHPLTVRYFLYDVRQRLDAAQKHFDNEGGASLDDLLRSIEAYASAYDDPATPNVVEKPQDRISKAEQSASFLQKAFNRPSRDLRDYADEYHRKSSTQLGNIEAYLWRKLGAEVLNLVLTGLAALIGFWEDFFDNLEALQSELRKDANKTLGEHEGRLDPTVEYVLAGKRDKESLWGQLNQQHGVEAGSSALNRTVYQTLYGTLCSWRNKKPTSLTDLKSAFKKDLLEAVSDIVEERLQLSRSVGAALCDEAAVGRARRQPSTSLAGLIRSVKPSATPSCR